MVLVTVYAGLDVCAPKIKGTKRMVEESSNHESSYLV